jgi:hypothetical protein
MASTSKTYEFIVTTGLGTTATSAAAAYPVYPIGVSGAQTFTSFKEKGAGYYGTTTGKHTLTVTTTPNFLGSVLIQGSVSIDPAENDWFNIDNAIFTYNEASPGYNAGSGLGQSPTGQGSRTDYLNFTGQFTYTRSIVTSTQGAVMFINYNY